MVLLFVLAKSLQSKSRLVESESLTGLTRLLLIGRMLY